MCVCVHVCMCVHVRWRLLICIRLTLRDSNAVFLRKNALLPWKELTDSLRVTSITSYDN